MVGGNTVNTSNSEHFAYQFGSEYLLCCFIVLAVVVTT